MTLSPINRTLLAAVKHDDQTGIEALVRAGASIEALEASLGRSSIAAALERGFFLSALGLLQSGAPLHAPSPVAPSPLMALLGSSALFDLALDFTELLLAKGADANEAGPQGERPLHACARLGRSDIAEALLRHGALIDALDREGRSALMTALEHGPDAVTPSLLISRGARLDLTDRLGRDAAALARARGDQQVAQAIEAAIMAESSSQSRTQPSAAALKSLGLMD